MQIICMRRVLLSLFIAIGLIGCDPDRENIRELYIEHVEIAATKIETANYKYFAVNVVVTALLADGCEEHDKTSYPKRDRGITEGPPLSLWRDGDVIEIKITGYSVPAYGCYLFVRYYHESIFIGYFEPGEYTVDVNGYTQTFRVG